MWHGERRIDITSSALAQLDQAWLNNKLPKGKEPYKYDVFTTEFKKHFMQDVNVASSESNGPTS